ncbi:MAG: hypothetical protein A3B91_00905 [Candidatus Yanofskybacteria bacterium RIFCSPHIGHO2_02_FULL_41_29]|uniref:GWxTD domain-containing protein n=1 Tax=Candidatus Yanofskybacteria bacterium RIFCSPHIGHO2_01_FULL_41_53 TaxID=1802663 RepID=A0A1F8EJL6_9BACT|nr:MAG: hypothetical protein A2650_02465 [Candidatus Yanofskybacteria bacterium RIFCSPHIGHO2_01_FULL_41_53]OGN11407.1 MAG: hypothetical protein A3B91_00905 [Candidatus Yanofskybacteria bacterium RIFCSPHIGHO2_02_FULL_41_29]OGN19148.1 MAG: hypothetical protein A3F48_01690 [Candidatus Yanofskybacteria bacterium RIFCSPHIGHO2_12_FULL_41_9]OGN21358.1 MAG: hypothetical protein A2916_03795 [Candidatus Yanofskybacteria bacterium RIFCSPLOWO2_01_FULL_41_67]OGN28853.1 MAG: hypothetical protein A3H54_01770 
MTRRLIFFALMVSAFFSVSIVEAAPSDKNCTSQDADAKKYCNDFMEKYGFFVTNPELKDLKSRHTLKSIEEFEADFWKKRDTDPNTSDNEFKILIDRRLLEIQTEILTVDFDIPGTLFSSTGGLKGDMAHVYLFYGMPHIKRRLSGNQYMADLMTWYYFDENGRVLFRFLFINKLGRVLLFDRHNFSFEYRLEALSMNINPTVYELQIILDYLFMRDPENLFYASVVEFSYYSDMTLSKALDPPDPISLIAERTKPLDFGQSNIPKDKEFIYGKFKSFIGANLAINGDKTNKISMELMVLYSGMDWEVIKDRGRGNFDLRISFQNKVTRAISEFEVRFSFEIDLAKIKANPDSYFRIELDDLKNYRNTNDPENPEGTLKDITASIEPGDYVVNIDLRDTYTRKYMSWQEHIIKK